MLVRIIGQPPLGATIYQLQKLRCHLCGQVFTAPAADEAGDRNLCERALKKAILHRKNALSYKTRNGARVGDLFMSLIDTCQLNEANPFDSLTQLQRHLDPLAARPELWMPWNYREALT